MEEKRVVWESFSIETLHNFSKNWFDLETILKNNKSNLSDIFKINYRLLKEVQYKCLLNIIANVENYLNQNIIFSDDREEQNIKNIIINIENYNFLSDHQKQNISTIVEELIQKRIYLKKILAQWAVRINNILVNITKEDIGPYYLQIWMDDQLFKKIIYTPLITQQQIDGTAWLASTHPEYNNLTMIIYNKQHGDSKKTLQHETRHAKDFLISENSDNRIALETLAYASETWDFNEWEAQITHPLNYHFWEYEHNSLKKEINKLYIKLKQPSAINLDLLSIINYNQWWSILKSSEMDKYTQWWDNEIIKKEDPNKSLKMILFEEWIENPDILSWMVGTPRIMTIFRDDFYLLKNIQLLQITTKMLNEDISIKIKENKSLKKIILYKEVYDQINKDFLKKTDIIFEIIK